MFEVVLFNLNLCKHKMSSLCCIFHFFFGFFFAMTQTLWVCLVVADQFFKIFWHTLCFSNSSIKLNQGETNQNSRIQIKCPLSLTSDVHGISVAETEQFDLQWEIERCLLTPVIVKTIFTNIRANIMSQNSNISISIDWFVLFEKISTMIFLVRTLAPTVSIWSWNGV